MKCIAVIQSNHTDLLPGDVSVDHYCISALKESRHIDRIVIAASDTPQNEVFRDLANLWQIDCFLGYELDVVKRIISAAKSAGADEDSIIIRVLLNRFYLDIHLVDAMIDLLKETESDFIMLPYDFDINFGADVLTLDCLKRVDRCLTGESTEHLRFRPWLYIEENADLFKSAIFEDVPCYPPERLQEIRGCGFFSERDCGTFSYFTYKFIEKFLTEDDTLLDIACGSGEGSALLAGKCRHVTRADLSANSIREASLSHCLPNLNFDIQDGCNMTYADGSFSAIACMNTLEHVEDDRLLLQNCRRILKDGGCS
jgi:spore coat polysaccharide biosynthesis protein SpsF (cytidylyltransferase family)